MITIPEKVEELVNQSPYLREAMSDKLVNLSALARQLKPQIERELMKDITESAVFIALQRYAATMKPYYTANPGEFLINMGLRSDLFELTVKNSPGLLDELSRLAKNLQDERTSLFVFTQSQYETTIITSAHLEADILKVLEDETILSTIPALTAITLQRTKGQIERTGVLQFPMRILAWEGISVIEVLTTSNEMMLIVRDFEVNRAVVSIRQGLQSVKQQSQKSD
jgi:hypothetical protein